MCLRLENWQRAVVGCEAIGGGGAQKVLIRSEESGHHKKVSLSLSVLGRLLEIMCRTEKCTGFNNKWLLPPEGGRTDSPFPRSYLFKNYVKGRETEK